MILQYKRVWQHMRPAATGDTLRSMDIPPGPLYTRVLTALRTAWLDGTIHSTEEETALLHELLARENGE